MAVPAGPSEKRYIGNGVTTIFTVPFLVIQASDLAVYLGGVRQNSGYTQSGVGNPSSTVTFTIAPAVGVDILLQLDVPFERLNDYQESGDFLANTVNRDFDRLWLALKQLYRWGTRSLMLGNNDVDGNGWYRAKNNGIRDLRDPVNNQDAATKRSVELYVGSILETGQGPVNNAANIMYVDGSGTPGVLQDLVGGMIGDNLTIFVPSQFPETADAMDWLRAKTISNEASVTIKVADGFNPATRSTILNHPQGIRISIIGNQTDKSLCQIVATDGSSFDAFVVSDGNEFGRIDGVTIKKTTKSAGTGILSISGAAIKCGPNVEVENFYYSFAARDGATMNADGVVSRNAGDVGIWSFNGAHVSAVGAYAYSAIDATNDLGYGFQAEYGGTMECSFGFATGCRKAGFAAINGGVMRAHNTNSISNSGSGYLSGAKGHIAVNGATANTNGTWGYEVINDGTFSGPRGGAGNGQPLLTKPVAYFDNDVSQGGVRAITGTPLRVGSNGTDGVIIDVNGSVAFRCGTLAGSSAVNYGQVDASAAGQPVEYKVRGADANIDLVLSPKGIGNARTLGSAWNTTHFGIGLYHLWVDASGRLRIKSSAPTSDTDGTVVGAQS